MVTALITTNIFYFPGSIQEMEGKEESEMSAPKVPRLETDFSLRVVCQKKTDESLIKNPTSHKKLLDYIEERASYCDSEYPNIQRWLESETEKTLLFHAAT